MAYNGMDIFTDTSKNSDLLPGSSSVPPLASTPAVPCRCRCLLWPRCFPCRRHLAPLLLIREPVADGPRPAGDSSAVWVRLWSAAPDSSAVWVRLQSAAGDSSAVCLGPSVVGGW